MHKYKIKLIITCIVYVHVAMYVAFYATLAISKPVLLTLDFKNIGIQQALNIVATDADLTLMLEEGLTGKISLSVTNEPLKKLLDAIANQADINITLTDKQIIAKSKSQLPDENIKFIKHPVKTEVNLTLASKVISLKHSTAKNIKARLIDNKATKLLSIEGLLLANQNTNQILIFDTAPTIKNIVKAINFLDKKTISINIAANIFVANSTTAEALGARWGGRKTSGSLALTGGRLGSIAKDSFVSLGNAPITNFVNANPALSAITLGLGAGNSFLDLELSVLNTKGDVKILSKPTVQTTNNNPAIISSGVEIPYQVETSTKTNVSFRKANLELKVVPKIIDANHIIMDITIRNDDVGQIYQGLPAINVNSITTTVQVKNGQTALIGGIIKTNEQHLVSKVPFLGDLPWIGALFRYSSYSKQNWELMISVTPTTITDD